MADTVFTACFLNACNRNADIVGMANYAPIVNTRGCIFTHKDGIVLRGTYYVFYMFVKYLGEEIIDLWQKDCEKLYPKDKDGNAHEVDAIDVVATLRKDGKIAVSAINKDAESSRELILDIENVKRYKIYTLNGESTESYNDIGVDGIVLKESDYISCEGKVKITLEKHSVNIIEIETE